MEFLYFAGDDRFGALGVSLKDDTYHPHQTGPLPRLSALNAIDDTIVRLLAQDKLDDRLIRLVKLGASMGGTRPKALIQHGGAHWVLKFREPDESLDTPLIEHATMTLARHCGIRTASTQALALRKGHAVAVQRFDRHRDGWVHSLCAGVVLRACNQDPSYGALALWLRRKGNAVQGQADQDRRELFKRMVFNILIDNNDDHEKNHVVQMDDTGCYRLSPAFDVRPTGQALGFQLMQVGSQGAEATMVNALSEHRLFGLTQDQAEQAIEQVSQCVDGWKAHFKSYGVSDRDIDFLAAQIDRPFLRDQRRH